MSGRIGWLDVSHGVSGDMMLGACIDAGVPLDVLRAAVDALHLPERVTVHASPVTRAGLTATHVDVRAAAPAALRTRRDIDRLIAGADLPAPVRTRARAVFAVLADAEAAAHGIDPDQVHVHEAGARDSITDIVGTAAAVHHLGLSEVVCSPFALGGGTAATAHGLPIPGPAVLRLLQSAGAPAFGGTLDHELSTPTGVAIAVTLAGRFGPMPPLTVDAVGHGAGARDIGGHPSITRLVIGAPTDVASAPYAGEALIIETNIDDLDPRLWPATIRSLLDTGAADAWLTPILMKKGRPAHTLSVLTPAAAAERVRRVIFTHTSAIGVRQYAVGKTALPRGEETVDVLGHPVRIKIARLDGEVVNAMPEYEDVATVAAATGRPVKQVMTAALAARSRLT